MNIKQIIKNVESQLLDDLIRRFNDFSEDKTIVSYVRMNDGSFIETSIFQGEVEYSCLCRNRGLEYPNIENKIEQHLSHRLSTLEDMARKSQPDEIDPNEHTDRQFLTCLIKFSIL